jgi:RHS repeat-associated protein
MLNTACPQEKNFDRGYITQTGCSGDDKSCMTRFTGSRWLFAWLRFRKIGHLLIFVFAIVLGHPAHAQTYYDWQSAWGPNFATETELCIANLARINSQGEVVVSSFDYATPVGPPTAAGQNGSCEYTAIYWTPPSQVGVTYNYSTAGGTSEAIPGPQYWVSALLLPQAETCSANCVGDPINTAVGNVYTTEEDVKFAGAGAIAFRRFYNSADATGVDGVVSWRHSYDRSITTIYQNLAPMYPGASSVVSPQYSTQAAACTSGFAAIKSAVSAWASATATYATGNCVLTNGSATIATLPIQVYPQLPPPTTAIEYDVNRDDGQTLRYTLQNGVVNNPPGVSIRLAVTGSGFTITDDDDNVEVYNSAGVLQSIASRAGVVQTISYDAQGLFHAAVDSFGNSVTVTRNTQNSIGSIAVNGGGTVQYGYDGIGRLSTVTNLDSTSRSYVYAIPGYPSVLTANNALASIVDESGTTYSSWSYDSQERATSTQEAGGADAQSLVYNSNDSVTVTDALGAVRTFSYSRVGDINKVVGISGSQCPTCQESAATTFDSASWVSSRTDYNGNLTCYASDPVRGLELVRVEGFAPGSTCPANLSTYTPAAGTLQRKITTQWSTTWREPTLVTEPNRTTGYTLDSFGNVHIKTITDTSVTPNVARTWTYTYNSYGQMLTIDGPRTDVSDVTTIAYYTCSTGTQCGQIETITNALSQVTTFNTYNAYGQPLTITDPNGVVTTLAYDARQRLTSTQVGTETTGYSYWPIGLLETVTLPDSSTISYTYDGAHRLTEITDSAGNYINYTLDALGNRTADNTYDPTATLRRTHTRVFNALSQLYQDINAAGTAAVTTTLGYDPQGNQTSINAPLSRNTGKTFDVLNRLSQITDPNSGITLLGYDANDNVASVKDPRNLTTSYTHNGFNDVAKIVSPDSGTRTNTYDSGGNLKTATDARSAVATYTYDALNRATQVAYADQTIQFIYDAGTNGKGRLTSASDANHTLSWTYDTHGRVTGKGQTVGSVTKSVGYGYTNDDLTSIVTPSGQTVTYSYSNHQITSIVVGSTTILSGATYFPFGPVSGWTWGNSTSTSRTYDTDGKISVINTAADAIDFGYDNAFRITGVTDTGTSANSWTLGYDVLDRINSASKTGTTYGWTYDADGNRLTQTGTSASTFTPSTTSNRLNSTTGALARTYTYDTAGNTKTYSNLTYSYNDRGRMSSVTVGSTTSNYVYSALGQMIKKTVGSTATLLMYDEAGHLLGEYSSTGALIQETVWMGDVPVATLRPNGSIGCASTICVFYVHTDQLNAPRKVTRPSDAKLAWRWDADPFGTAAPNQNPASLGTFVYNLRFPGQYYQAETGLNQNYFRDYDPKTPRFIESDPIGLDGGSYSPYVYVANNPIQFIDPFGLDLTITLYQGTAGHIGIGVNSTSTYGFYPAANAAITPLDISVPGVEKPDAGEIPIDSITIHTDPQQDAAVQSFIKGRIKNPGKYNLYNRNCAITVEGALSSAKVAAPNDILPKSLFDWLKQKYPPHAPGRAQ